MKKIPLIKGLKQSTNDLFGYGEAEIEGTKYSNRRMKEVPLDLDLSNSQDMQIMRDVIYKLASEESLEEIIQYFYELKMLETVRYKVTEDALELGVFALRAYPSRTTGFFEFEHIDPSNVFTPHSKYPDFRDVPFIRIHHKVTPIELMNLFSGQIEDENKLDEIINGSNGYCKKNKIGLMAGGASINMKNQKIDLIEFQVVAADWIYQKDGLIVDEAGDFKDGYTRKSFQNTYKFFWLKDTDYYFGQEVLGFAQRTKGNEIYSRFDVQLYRSSTKSPAEHCIGANRKAQMASIKMMWTIIKAAPPGKQIDIKQIMNAVDSFLTSDSDDNTRQTEFLRLLGLAVQENIVITNSEGFDGANEGQFKAVTPIQGGLDMATISACYDIIKQSEMDISRWTGINDDIAGVNDNPNNPVFARKSNLIQGLTSMNHIQNGIVSVFKRGLNTVFYCIKDAIEKDGVERRAIENIIGVERTEIIDNLDGIKEHTFYLQVNLGNLDAERQNNMNTLMIMEQKGLITALHKLIFSQEKNPKKQAMLLSIIEAKAEAKQDQIRQEQMQNQQAIQQSKNEAQLGAHQIIADGRIANTQTKGQVDSQLMEQLSQLKLTEKEKEALLKLRIDQPKYSAKLAEAQMRKDVKEKEIEQKQLA